MKVELHQARSGDATLTERVEKAGGWLVEAGRKRLLVAANARWRAVREATSLHDADDAMVQDLGQGRLHGVCQKGRLFQQAHPEVPVLLDAGRYLVVDLSRSEATRINKPLEQSEAPCFRLFPLSESTRLFRQVAPRRDAAGSRAVDAVVASASQARYVTLLSQLVSYPTRLSSSAEYAQAVDWAESQLTTAGLAVDRQQVTLPGGASSINLLARLPGQAASPRHWLVVAHLDSVNHQGGPSAPAPGADDNASGSAALMLMAEVLAGQRFDDDLSFVLFGGEEQGLHGSRQFVAGLSAAERGRIAGVLNMDMIGSINATPAAVLLEGAPLSQDMIDGLSAAGGRFTDLELQVSLNPFASDHVPFIDAGIPAVLTIEGADGANDAIHGPNDLLATVDPSYAMKIVAMNLGFVATSAGLHAVDAAPLPECHCRGDERHHLGDPWRQLEAHHEALLAQYRRWQGQGVWSAQLDAGWRQAWQRLELLRSRREWERRSRSTGR